MREINHIRAHSFFVDIDVAVYVYGGGRGGGGVNVPMGARETASFRNEGDGSKLNFRPPVERQTAFP